MLKRRRAVLLSALGMLVPPAFGQQQRRVGILSGRSRAAATDIQDAFMNRMREFGYIDGRNMRYEWRFSSGHYQDLRALADELLRVKVEVIVAEGTSSV